MDEQEKCCVYQEMKGNVNSETMNTTVIDVFN